MTTLDGAVLRGPGSGRRAYRLRRGLVGDMVLLALLLVALSWWAGTDVSYTSDEQASVLQVQQLLAGEGWLVENPLPTIDPDGRNFYVVLSDHGTAGIAFYAKHPAYPVLLTAIGRWGGMTSMVLLSVAATVVAAGCGGGIGRRIDPRLARWSFWAVGIGSPLVFDSQLIVAHSLGAALAGGAVLVGRPWETPTRWGGWRVGVAALLLAATCLVRTEALLLALVVAGWALVQAVRQRSRGWAVAAVAWGVVGPAVLVLDRWLYGRIVGRAVAVGTPPSGSGSLVGTQLNAAVNMLIGPGDGWSPRQEFIVLGVFVASAVLGWFLRKSRPPVVALAGTGVLGVVAALALVHEPDAVRGILIACPVVTVGLVAWRHALFDLRPVRSLAVITVAYTAAVAATTYAEGGGLEWGARYLAIVLPLGVPLAVASVHWAITRLAEPARRAALGSVVAISLAIAAVGLNSLRTAHGNVRAIVTNLESATARISGADLGDGDRRPIVITTMYPLGRLTLGPGPDIRGLTVLSDDELRAVGERLRAAGVTEFVLATEKPADPDLLAPHYRVRSRERDGRMLVMEAA